MKYGADLLAITEDLLLALETWPKLADKLVGFA